MSIVADKPLVSSRPVHSWLRQVKVSFVPGISDPLLEQTVEGILRHSHLLGHIVQDVPDDTTDVLLTTAPFGEPLNWRRALLFTARRRFGLSHNPMPFTLVHARPAELRSLLQRFETALAKEPPDPADFDFPGLAPTAYQVLVEQGQRGGPIMAIERLLQAQAKSIRVLLVVGEERPLRAYHFDLVGAYPVSDATNLELFYQDIVLRIVTAISAAEVNKHQMVDEPISRSVWQKLDTPAAMCQAAQELGRRHFFTNMVRIPDLVQVPAVADAVASQYSEGCFATWDTTLGALVATVTGSARPVDKKNITEDDLAVIVGVRPDGRGALTRQVEGKRNDPPSTEAVEMFGMDTQLPRIGLGAGWNGHGTVPVIRSKLHGHRGVDAFNPAVVEYVPLEAPYYHYLVTCGTGAQAQAVKGAFSRSQALHNPADPRQIVFTVLPGHGVILVEKWVPGKVPFQVLWEAMDAGDVVIASKIPQGPMEFVPGDGSRLVVRSQDVAW